MLMLLLIVFMCIFGPMGRTGELIMLQWHQLIWSSTYFSLLSYVFIFLGTNALRDSFKICIA